LFWQRDQGKVKRGFVLTERRGKVKRRFVLAERSRKSKERVCSERETEEK